MSKLIMPDLLKWGVLISMPFFLFACADEIFPQAVCRSPSLKDVVNRNYQSHDSIVIDLPDSLDVLNLNVPPKVLDGFHYFLTMNGTLAKVRIKNQGSELIEVSRLPMRHESVADYLLVNDETMIAWNDQPEYLTRFNRKTGKIHSHKIDNHLVGRFAPFLNISFYLYGDTILAPMSDYSESLNNSYCYSKFDRDFKYYRSFLPVTTREGDYLDSFFDIPVTSNIKGRHFWVSTSSGHSAQRYNFTSESFEDSIVCFSARANQMLYRPIHVSDLENPAILDRKIIESACVVHLFELQDKLVRVIKSRQKFFDRVKGLKNTLLDAPFYIEVVSAWDVELVAIPANCLYFSQFLIYENGLYFLSQNHKHNRYVFHKVF